MLLPRSSLTEGVLSSLGMGERHDSCWAGTGTNSKDNWGRQKDTVDTDTD
jgi:hypothetical protein